MFQFNYYRGETVKDICTQLDIHKEKARVIAGGTDLMVQIREKDEKWAELDLIVDISNLQSEMKYIIEEEAVIRIGALSTHTEIENSEIVKKYCPFLSVACSTVGSPQIRNMGTIGGSICNASPAADPLSPLIAADAKVLVQGVDGQRIVALREFYHGKGKVDLNSGELLLEFIVPKMSAGTVTHFEKLGRRKALAISRLNVAVALEWDENQVITFARVAPGCIFTVPDRVVAAEEAILGQKISRELFVKAGLAVSEEMIKRTGVRWSTEYKQPAIEGLVERALLKAVGLELE